MKCKTGNSISVSEPGAPAVSGSISLCVPETQGNEWKYIKECLDTGKNKAVPVTRNASDFRGIVGLQVIDPFEQPLNPPTDGNC